MWHVIFNVSDPFLISDDSQNSQDSQDTENDGGETEEDDILPPSL